MMKRFSLRWCLLAASMLAQAAFANPFLQAKWPDTDFSTAIVEMNEIISGGPPKDGIPAIDDPRFDDVETAAAWLNQHEPVILVEEHGQARAYPLQLLIYHEIVNDRIDDTPFTVTFCPLCNSSVVFDRRLDGRLLDFGTTGLLRKSDMVMYDRQTETWWQQITGRGIVGEYAGATLVQIPSRIVSFSDFAEGFPEGKVVNRDTGHDRPYGNNPYRGYDDIDQAPFLFRDTPDPRLPPMERVMHLEIGEQSRLYPFSKLDESGVVNDTVGGQPVVLFSRSGLLSVLDAGQIADSREIQAVTAFMRELNGQVLEFEVSEGRIRDLQTGSTWNLLGQAAEGQLQGQSLRLAPGAIHFAFAWLAFDPEVEIYGISANSK